jgi:hypothetical protein
MKGAEYPKRRADVTLLTCEVPGCRGIVSHAEHWNNTRGYRLWCYSHTPWSGHFSNCADECSDLLLKLKADAHVERDAAAHHEAIGREVLRLWQRASVEHHSKERLGDDVDKLMCWGTEAEREARRQAISDAEIRKFWAE